MVAGYTQEVYIRNQTLWVHLTSPALRADLSMMKQDIVKKLNAAVDSQVIVDIRFC
jgi:predicted nucleic acid-binding Zn ribbon protein